MNRNILSLDRVSGVYAAGEVVSGFVYLNFGNEQALDSCYGVTLDMIGRSRAHFSTAGHLHTEKVIFVHHRYTLFGNTYATTLHFDRIDRIFRNTIFSGCENIYIPSGPNDSKCSVILLIRDDDENNLGTFDINLNSILKGESLDNKGTFQAESKFGILTYTAFHSQPLFQSQSTRRNTNDNPLDTVITLKVFSFEPISETFAPTESIKIMIKRVIENEEDISREVKLSDCPASIRFWFPTEPTYPGSCFVKQNDTDYAHLEYYIFVRFEYRNNLDSFVEIPISILPTIPVPQRELLRPIADDSVNMHIMSATEQVQGSVKCHLILHRSTFSPGEELCADGSRVVNYTRRNIVVTLKLERLIMFCVAHDDESSQTQRVQSFPLFEGLCSPLSSIKLPSTGITVPAIPPSYFGVGIGWIEPFTVCYSVTLDANIGKQSICSSKTAVLISAVSPKLEYLDTYSSVSPKLHNKELKALAITNNDFAEVVVPKTKIYFDDIIVPAFIEECNIYQTKAKSSLGNIVSVRPYIPFVRMYSVPSNNCFRNGDINQSSLNHDSALTEIVQSLKTEEDSFSTVSIWMQEHPSISKHLTPVELAIIIKSVKYQVYIPCIVREIAVHHTNLTTQHIQSVLDTRCLLFNVQIVRNMLPYVVDSNHKAQLLASFHPCIQMDILRTLTLAY